MKTTLSLLAASLCVLASTVAAVAADAPAPPAVAALKAAGFHVDPAKGGGYSVEPQSAADLTEERWKLIESLGDVRRFSCGGSEFDDAALARLAKLKSLRHVFLNGPAVTDGGLAVLADLPDLQSVGVHHSTTLTGAGLVALKDRPNFTAVEFGGCAKVDDDSVKSLVRLVQLRDVKLGHDRITRASFPLLAELPHLEVLEITPNWDPGAYTAADFAAFERAKALREVEIHDMALPCDNGLDHLAAIPTLTTLKLYWCYATPSDLEKLKARRPDLKVDYDHAAGEDKLRQWEERAGRSEQGKK